MRKKRNEFMVAAGAVLLFSALLLFFHNIREDLQAKQQSDRILTFITSAAGPRTSQSGEKTGVPELTGDTAVSPLSPELPSVEIDGHDYVGSIELPRFEIELPVMAEWDYDRLKIAPCRQFGSSRTDDLVIAAHNYTNHFGRLKELKCGDTVLFTDMERIVNTYTVDRVETLAPDNPEAVRNSDSDMVLYTCTVGGSARVAVFCRRAMES